MNRILPLFSRSFLLLTGLVLSLDASPVTRAGEGTLPNDAELAAKERAVKLAEAEANLQKALREIAQARKDAETASDSALRNIEREKAEAQAEQAIAEAEKARFAARLPTSSSKPLEGNIDIDDKAGYFAEILAYECMRDCAADMAEAILAELNAQSIRTVYLVQQSDHLKGAVQLQEVKDRLAMFNDTFDALLRMYTITDGTIARSESAGLLALAAVPAALTAAADVAALFRVDRSLRGRTTTVTDEALMAEIGRVIATKSALQNNGVTRPAQPATAVVENSQPQRNRITVVRPCLTVRPEATILADLQGTRRKAERVGLRLAEIRAATAMASHQIEIIQSKIAAAQKRREDAKEHEKEITEQLKTLAESLEGPRAQKVTGDIAIPLFEGTLKTFYEFASALVSVSDGRASPLATLAEICLLRDCSSDECILSVAVASQGGEVETRKSLWTGGRVYHRAGCICTYVLYDNQGRIVDSGLAVADRQSREGKRMHTARRPSDRAVREER